MVQKSEQATFDQNTAVKQAAESQLAALQARVKAMPGGQTLTSSECGKVVQRAIDQTAGASRSLDTVRMNVIQGFIREIRKTDPALAEKLDSERRVILSPHGDKAATNEYLAIVRVGARTFEVRGNVNDDVAATYNRLSSGLADPKEKEAILARMADSLSQGGNSTVRITERTSAWDIRRDKHMDGSRKKVFSPREFKDIVSGSDKPPIVERVDIQTPTQTVMEAANKLNEAEFTVRARISGRVETFKIHFDTKDPSMAAKLRDPVFLRNTLSNLREDAVANNSGIRVSMVIGNSEVPAGGIQLDAVCKNADNLSLSMTLKPKKAA